MKNKIFNIVTDLTFILFLGLALSHVLSLWLGYPIWWTAKYSLILFAGSAIYQLIQKGNSVLLVTIMTTAILVVTLPFLP
jgi:FtsH-binding integral membrane protein